MTDDFLSEVIRLLGEAFKDGPDAVRKTEIKIRQQSGGGRHYIGKAPTLGKTQRLADGLAAGVSLGEAFAAAGVSRSAGYRFLSRRWRR